MLAGKARRQGCGSACSHQPCRLGIVITYGGWISLLKTAQQAGGGGNPTEQREATATLHQLISPTGKRRGPGPWCLVASSPRTRAQQGGGCTTCALVALATVCDRYTSFDSAILAHEGVHGCRNGGQDSGSLFVDINHTTLGCPGVLDQRY